MTAFYKVDFWVEEAPQLHWQTVVMAVNKQMVVTERERGYPNESAGQAHQHNRAKAIPISGHQLEFNRDVQEVNVMFCPK